MTTEYEVPVDPNRLCFNCGKTAVMEYTVSLTSAHADDVDFAEILDGAKPTRGTLRLLGDVCEECDTAFSEAVEDALNRGVTGRSLTRSTCPDPWHFDEDAYERSETEPESMGGGWVHTGYRCPTCGFDTFKEVAIPPNISDHPAYVATVRALTAAP